MTIVLLLNTLSITGHAQTDSMRIWVNGWNTCMAEAVKDFGTLNLQYESGYYDGIYAQRFARGDPAWNYWSDGYFTLFRSTSNSGSPGTMVMNFDASGNATLAGSLTLGTPLAAANIGTHTHLTEQIDGVGMPSDSTGLSSGNLWFDSATGIVHRKY